MATAGALDALNGGPPERALGGRARRPVTAVRHAGRHHRRPGRAARCPGMCDVELTVADIWATGISPDVYPTEFSREQLSELGVRTAQELHEVEHGTRVLVAGMVTHRQRPATASGVIFHQPRGRERAAERHLLGRSVEPVPADRPRVGRAAGPRAGGAGRRGHLHRGRPDGRGGPGRPHAVAGFPMTTAWHDRTHERGLRAGIGVADPCRLRRRRSAGQAPGGRRRPADHRPGHDDRRLGGVRAGGEPDIPAGAVQRAVRVRGRPRGQSPARRSSWPRLRRCPAPG